ncbi:polycomb group RING finger protein 6 isoform X4 [Gymnodraco acuticeps]|uniref:Polycomb group RING finger protein 6 isoform X4 n=1 Tax=Gymnodraco acuticeps TaxID=8218 RepID=A0A6P8V6C1_GYMAC|nr:polycomb group RING finger protein 6 isoform X4 [Gymnodraco acuticeps]
MLPRLSHEGTTNDSEDEEEPERPLSEFYPYIRCALCSYFLIDATTIIECLHTFCKSCIVKHFFYNNRCPTCSTVVHQTQPTYNIRPDRQLQDIVYKMVPFLEESERKQMCQFYKERGLDVPNTGPVVIKRQKKENIPPSVFTIPPELDVSLLLEFVGAEEGIANYKYISPCPCLAVREAVRPCVRGGHCAPRGDLHQEDDGAELSMPGGRGLWRSPPRSLPVPQGHSELCG